MDIRPIKNAEDLAWGLREIEKGMSGPVRPGSPQGDRLEVIMTLVHAYEKAQHPMPRVDPIEAIQFRMEQEGSPPPTCLLNLELVGVRPRFCKRSVA
jgi:HTH-type transcriptional regulator/antitoxin HigA